jgi:hypothetical protein
LGLLSPWRHTVLEALLRADLVLIACIYKYHAKFSAQQLGHYAALKVALTSFALIAKVHFS